jgi:hypothetical protein
MPSLLPEGVPTLAACFPTLETAARAQDGGNGLARVTPTSTLEPTAGTGSSGDGAGNSGGMPAEDQVTRQTATPVPTSSSQAITPEPGALVRVSMSSQVGVLLDEIPAQMRECVAQALLDQPDEDWLARARRQVQLTRLRLNFRDSNEPGKGQLPLTQPDLWSIVLDEAGPQRRTVQGHELIMVDYTFSTTVLSDPESVARSEPALADAGGVWEEYFLLPADPDLLLQRTGRACLNTAGFPPNSVDSENAGHFFDYDRQNCFEVLAGRVGAIETRMRFQRVSWNAALADRVRTDPPSAKMAPTWQ